MDPLLQETLFRVMFGGRSSMSKHVVLPSPLSLFLLFTLLSISLLGTSYFLRRRLIDLLIGGQKESTHLHGHEWRRQSEKASPKYVLDFCHTVPVLAGDFLYGGDIGYSSGFFWNSSSSAEVAAVVVAAVCYLVFTVGLVPTYFTLMGTERLELRRRNREEELLIRNGKGRRGVRASKNLQKGQSGFSIRDSSAAAARK